MSAHRAPGTRARRIVALAMALTAASAHGAPPDNRSAVDAPNALDAQGFARAVRPRAWSFPRDHGSHPAYATEWWYFTGIVRDRGGSHTFGYELTFFRSALRAGLPTDASPWRARDLIVAHLAVTDVRGKHFDMAELVQRAAVGLAGADTSGLWVWAEDWSARARQDTFTLRALAGDLGVDLTLTPARGVVLHGDRGLSTKSEDGRHASYYYSMPRLRTSGGVTSRGTRYEVEGTTWMDHEFFSGDTPREGLGWDWFSARLADGRDVMVYVVRAHEPSTGRLDVHAQGTLVAPDGTARPLDTAEMTSTPLETWTGPETQIAYPVRWRLALPREALELQVAALLPQQEIRATRSVGFAYWEGASTFAGALRGVPIEGEGYVELTGYEPIRREVGPR